jgi:transposase
MGRRSGDQPSLFYEFRLDDRIPKNHLLRGINAFVTAALADVHEQLDPYYSEIGRPSVDPELMIRMLIVGYCYALRSERKLTQEVELHLAYRWFCRLDLDDRVPHHSTFSENRLHRFRESDVFRHIFERVVSACMAAGLVKGEGFAVDASVMEANASRYHGKAPAEIKGPSSYTTIESRPFSTASTHRRHAYHRCTNHGRLSRNALTLQVPSREFQPGNRTAVMVYALGRSATTVSVMICVMMSGMTLMPKRIAHMAAVGGANCMTSAIGGR